MSTVGLGILAAFAAAALLFVAAQDYLLERMRVYRSLRTVRAVNVGASDVRRRELALPLPSRIIAPGMRRVGRLARRFTPASVVERLARNLAYAGEPAGWDAERVLAFKFLGGGVLGVGTLLLAPVVGANPVRAVILAVMLGVVGYFLPDLILRSRYEQRQDEIRRALPDSLDLLSITVEAGLGFDAAIARVSREVAGPLGREFHRVVQELQLGRTRTDAFRDLAERSTIPELKSFVLSMVQADIFGISVAKVLQVQAHEMRVKRRQRAEEKAQKIPVKLVFPLIFCIFPALFVILLGPAAIRIYQNLFLRSG